MPWYVKSSEYSEDISEITLGFKSNEETRKIWNYDFELSLKISVSMKLTMELTSTNTGDKPFWVTEGFHPYLRVRDIDQVTIKGVDGCEFYDTECPEKGDKRIWVGDVTVEEGSKVFKVDKLEYALIDNGLDRAIAMVSRGNKKLIVWNPGEAPFVGLNDGDYKKFVCVEPSTLFRDAGYELKAGESHDLKIAIQSVPNDGSVHACK